MKKKVLFLAHWYPSKKNSTAGVFIQKHAEAIGLEHDITIIHFDIQHSSTLFDCKLYKKKEEKNETLVIQIYSRFYKYFYYFIPLQFFLFKRIIKKFQIELKSFDLVHSNVLFPTGIVAYKISKRYNLPQYHTEHWSKFNDFLKRDPLRHLGKKAIDNCVKVSAVSRFFKNEISKNIDSSKIQVIPNVIEQSIFKFKEKNISETIHFLAVANWQKPKNPLLLFNALEKLKSSSSYNFDLTVIGDGPLLKAVKSNKYSFDVTYVGIKPNIEIVDYFHQADYFLHASDFETFSVVIVEALSTGTPVIVSNVGIASEIINSENGIMCENEVEKWVYGIKQVFEKLYDNKKISDSFQNKFEAKKILSLFNDFYNIESN